MNYKEFEMKLKELCLTKKAFANLLEINHTTITKWRINNKIPKYAEIALMYLIELKNNCDKLNKIKENDEN